MIVPFFGKKPKISAAAFLAPNATVVGEVALGEGASVWYGAVLRADTGRIGIGAGSNLQDNVVVHTGPQLDVSVGENVTVGHSAILHGCTVGDNSLIGMHATLMNGCKIGKNCVVGAGALVPEGMEVPDGTLVLGVPARVKGLITQERAAANLANAAHYREMAAAHAAALRQTESGLHIKAL
ncbi:MAG: gamma carbonic anhydrase family protein [Faecalibacterium sp.]|jgi:carbonic anhydrase/acetyltransferase-like protein (isoleucine patch superfamily)|nr:gamma carbonic anhydrase family protein [Faecalibacterium sp.]